MYKHFYQNVLKSGLIPAGSNVLAAVSGGADSVALLCLLHDCARLMKLRLTAAHLNHMIRGKEADGDEKSVQELCRRLKIPVITGRADVPALAKARNISMEMAAREARYGFLGDAAAECGADMVVTAHTADDQAETFILKLARGAGSAGLGGISPLAVIGGVKVVRPMLDFNRSDIEVYLKSIGVKWREDSSNRDTVYLRNMVRKEILPVLEQKLNPSIKKVIRAAADILRDEDAWLDSLVTPLFHKCLDGDCLSAAKLAKLPTAAVRRIIQRWLSHTGVPAEHIDFAKIEKVRGIAERDNGETEKRKNYELQITNVGAESRIGDSSPSAARHRATQPLADPPKAEWLRSYISDSSPSWIVGAESHSAKYAGCRNSSAVQKTQIGGNMFVVLKNGKLAVEKISSRKVCKVCRQVRIPGETVIGEMGISISAKIGRGIIRERKDRVMDLPASASLAWKKGEKLVVRSWRNGDRISPFGMEGTKKLQDLFIDAKVPKETRDLVPVFAIGKEVVWIPGYRICASRAVSSDKAECLHVEVKRKMKAD